MVRDLRSWLRVHLSLKLNAVCLKEETSEQLLSVLGHMQWMLSVQKSDTSIVLQYTSTIICMQACVWKNWPLLVPISGGHSSDLHTGRMWQTPSNDDLMHSIRSLHLHSFSSFRSTCVPCLSMNTYLTLFPVHASYPACCFQYPEGKHSLPSFTSSAPIRPSSSRSSVLTYVPICSLSTNLWSHLNPTHTSRCVKDSLFPLCGVIVLY